MEANKRAELNELKFRGTKSKIEYRDDIIG